MSLAAMLLVGAAAPSAPAFRDPNLPADQRIASLLSLGTIGGKIDALSTDTGVPRLGVPSFSGLGRLAGGVEGREAR